MNWTPRSTPPSVLARIDAGFDELPFSRLEAEERQSNSLTPTNSRSALAQPRGRFEPSAEALTPDTASISLRPSEVKPERKGGSVQHVGALINKKNTRL